MARTTLTLEDDAMEIARRHAARLAISLGEAVSDLVRQAAERPLATEEKNGLRIVRLGQRSPKISSALVKKLADELP